jgi:hypothetical protein
VMTCLLRISHTPGAAAVLENYESRQNFTYVRQPAYRRIL